eukprot:superscaffoldBa00005005_g19768
MDLLLGFMIARLSCSSECLLWIMVPVTVCSTEVLANTRGGEGKDGQSPNEAKTVQEVRCRWKTVPITSGELRLGLIVPYLCGGESPRHLRTLP